MTQAQIVQPPAGVLASAGEASELDRLLQLERAKADSRALALEPADFAAAKEFAKIIAESGMFPDKDGKAPTMGSILLRIMTGRTLEIASSIALQHVYDVYGRTGLSAALKRSLVRRHRECERYEMVECDEAHCVWISKRKRNLIEHPVLWTLDMAKKAGLIKKDGNWEKHPRRMLQARASSEAADVDFSDACLGLPSIDEIYESSDYAIAGAAYSVPVTTGPTRDWRKETDEVMATVLRLVDEGRNREAREAYALFKQDAPEQYANEIFDAYNKALAAKKGEPPPPAKATKPSVDPYLPPDKRGDSYAGPEKP